MRKAQLHIALFFILLFIGACTKPINITKRNLENTGNFQFGASNERIFYHNVNIDTSLTLKWRGESYGSYGSNSFIINDKYMFTADLGGRMYGYEVETGAELGYEKFDGGLVVTPVLHEKKLFFGYNEDEGESSKLVIYDIITGKIIDEKEVKGSFENEFILAEDGIIVLFLQGDLTKYDFSGNEKWRFKTGYISKSSPAANEDIILFGNSIGEVIGVDFNGEEKLRFDTHIAIESNFTIKNGNAYFGNNDGTLFSFSIDENKINWKYDTGTKIVAAPAVVNDRIYAGNLGGYLFTLNAPDGIKLWKYSSGGLINSSPLVFNNYILLPDLDRKLHFIDRVTGIQKHLRPFETKIRNTPVFYKGLLFVGADRGEIFTFETTIIN